MTETEKAYMAGIIDGEGCIYIDKYKDKRNHTGNYQYVLRVKVAMTCKKTIKYLYDIVSTEFKCYMNIAQGKKFEDPKMKQAYIFCCNSGGGIKFLQSIYPYLVTKKKRAKLGIEYGETIFDNRVIGRKGNFLAIPKGILETKERIHQEIRFFNQTGE